MKSDKPIIVSMGEPSGISSEIIIKAWLKRDLYKIPPFILNVKCEIISFSNYLIVVKPGLSLKS